MKQKLFFAALIVALCCAVANPLLGQTTRLQGKKKAFPKEWSFAVKHYRAVDSVDVVSGEVNRMEIADPTDPLTPVFDKVYLSQKMKSIYSRSITFRMTRRSFRNPEGEVILGNNKVIAFGDLPPDALAMIKDLDGSLYLGTFFDMPWLASFVYPWYRPATEEQISKVESYVPTDEPPEPTPPAEHSSIIMAIIQDFNKKAMVSQVLDGTYDFGSEFMLGGTEPVALSFGRPGGMNIHFGMGSRVSAPGIALEDNSIYFGVKTIKGLSIRYRIPIPDKTAFWGDDKFIRNKLPYASLLGSRYLEINGPIGSWLFSDLTGFEINYQVRTGGSYDGPIGYARHPDDTSIVYKSSVKDEANYVNFAFRLPLMNVFDGENYYGIHYYQKEWYALVEFKRMNFDFSVVDLRMNYRFYSNEKNRNRFVASIMTSFPRAMGGDFFSLGAQFVLGQGRSYFEPVVSFRIPTDKLYRDKSDYSREAEADAE